MKSFLAVLEGLLTLAVAWLLSLLLVLGGTFVYWVAIEQKPLSEAPWLKLAYSARSQDEDVEISSASPSVSPATIAAFISIQAVVFVGLALAMRRLRIRPADPSARAAPLLAGLMGLLAGIAAVVGTFLLSLLMGMLGLEITEQPWVLDLVGSDPRGLALLAPWIVLLGPFAEELFFRGYLFRFLSQQTGAATAYIVSSLTFAAIHFHPPLIPFYVMYGLIFAFIYRRTSRLLAPFVAHAVINGVGLLSLLAAATQKAV